MYVPINQPDDRPDADDVIDGELAGEVPDTAVEPYADDRDAFRLPTRIQLTEPASDHPMDMLYAWCFDSPIRIVLRAVAALTRQAVVVVERVLSRIAGTIFARFLGVLGALASVLLVVRLFR